VNFDGAYKRADELLYEAKHAGGNTIRSNIQGKEAA
jgi:PleD family two-component response regulator